MGEGLHLGELRQLVLSHRPLVEEVNALAVLELTLHDEADLVGIELPYPILLGIAYDIVDQLVLIDLDGLFVVGIIVELTSGTDRAAAPAAAGVLAAMPQIAATGVLGEDAAVVVSTEKLLARRERLVRENIDTRYLKIESLGRIYVGQGRREQDLRLVGSFSLTEAAQADLAAAATALTNLSVYGSLHRLSVTYGGVDLANDPQNVANTVTNEPVSPLRVNESAILNEEQWLKVLTANAALGTNASYAQVGLLADELRLNAVVIDENYESLMKRFRTLAELDLKNERVQQIHLNIQLAPEKALSLPSGAQSKISVSVAESSRVATVSDVLSKAATKKELNTLASFSLVWNAREKYPSASQWDGLKLGFTAPESKEESAKEAQRTAVRKYLQEVSGPLQALTKREATVPGEVIT